MFRLTQLTIRRARQERLAQIAGSLTFTTVLSIVPFLSVAFALFMRFPVFSRFEAAIDDLLLKPFLPADIARTVLKYLHQFSSKASSMTWMGSVLLLAAAVALLLTVENALNQLWGVKRNRPFIKRVGMYTLMLLVGPPVLGVSLWATSYVVSASMGTIGPLPPSARFVLGMGPLVLGAIGLSCLLYFVPNAKVPKHHAIAGGLIASIGLELGKRGFAAYLLQVPTYKEMYGAFEAVPIFLLWVYFSWLVILGAALVTANLSRSLAKS
jgi:membrane protein